MPAHKVGKVHGKVGYSLTNKRLHISISSVKGSKVTANESITSSNICVPYCLLHIFKNTSEIETICAS